MLDNIYDTAIETSIENQKILLKLQEEFLSPYTTWERRNEILKEEMALFKYESAYLQNVNEALKH